MPQSTCNEFLHVKDVLWLCFLSSNTGVTLTVGDRIRYVVNESEGLVNITIALDRPSCVPITVIATPVVGTTQST